MLNLFSLLFNDKLRVFYEQQTGFLYFAQKGVNL